MKKSLLAICWQQRFAIALTTAAISLAFCGVANAEENGWRLNGIEFQGWHLNGIKLQGIKLQGTTMQATKLQGMELQNLKVIDGQLVAETRVAAQ